MTLNDRLGANKGGDVVHNKYLFGYFRRCGQTAALTKVPGISPRSVKSTCCTAAT